MKLTAPENEELFQGLQRGWFIQLSRHDDSKRSANHREPGVDDWAYVHGFVVSESKGLWHVHLLMKVGATEGELRSVLHTR